MTVKCVFTSPWGDAFYFFFWGGGYGVAQISSNDSQMCDHTHMRLCLGNMEQHNYHQMTVKYVSSHPLEVWSTIQNQHWSALSWQNMLKWVSLYIKLILNDVEKEDGLECLIDIFPFLSSGDFVWNKGQLQSNGVFIPQCLIVRSEPGI